MVLINQDLILMRQELTLETAPKPTNPKVHLEPLAPRILAVHTFSGSYNWDNYQRMCRPLAPPSPFPRSYLGLVCAGLLSLKIVLNLARTLSMCVLAMTVLHYLAACALLVAQHSSVGRTLLLSP